MSEKVTFSLPCLKSLLSSDTSCVYCQKGCKRSLSLLPVHLPNLKSSIKEIFDSKVTFYDSELDGIILSHKNVKIHSSVELGDDGNFKLDYSADIYIFKPSIGSVLTGQVNKKCKDVIGCLVHSVFYVTIPRSKNSGKPWLGQNVTMGQTVHFKVVKLDYTSRLPFIKGELISVEEGSDEGMDSGVQECVEDNVVKKKKKLKHKVELTEPEKSRKRKCLEEFDVERENKKAKINAIAEDIIFSPPAPVKKEKKKKEKSSDLEDNIYEEALASSTMLIDSPIKKKKKSKKHSKDFLENLENELLTQAIASIDKVDSLPKEEKIAKKKKKHSHNIETDIQPVSVETSPKKKKKHSHNIDIQPVSDEISPKKKKNKKFSNTIADVKIDEPTIKDLESQLLNDALASMDQGSSKKNKSVEETPIKKKKQKQLLINDILKEASHKKDLKTQSDHSELSPVKDKMHKNVQISPVKTEILANLESEKKIKKKKKHQDNPVNKTELLAQAVASIDKVVSPAKEEKIAKKEKKHSHNIETDIQPVSVENSPKKKKNKKFSNNPVSDITELLAQAEASLTTKKKVDELIEESSQPVKIKKKKKNIDNTPVKESDNLVDQLLAQAEATTFSTSKKKKKQNGLQIDEDLSPKINKKKHKLSE